MKVPRIARTKMPWTYLTADEIEKLTGPLVEQTNRDVFTFAIFSGLREGEIFGLQWTDVDLDARTAHIRVSWKGTPTKRGHVRTLNLFEPAVQALVRQKERTGKGAYFSGNLIEIHHSAGSRSTAPRARARTRVRIVIHMGWAIEVRTSHRTALPERFVLDVLVFGWQIGSYEIALLVG